MFGSGGTNFEISPTMMAWSCLVLRAEQQQPSHVTTSCPSHVNKFTDTLPSSTMDQKLLDQILDALTNAHGATLYDMVLETL
jgi:hypothetical protein